MNTDSLDQSQELARRERLTIGKLFFVTTCFALAFCVYPLVYLYPPLMVWSLMAGFIGSAIGHVWIGRNGVITGFIAAALIPYSSLLLSHVILNELSFAFVLLWLMVYVWRRLFRQPVAH